MIKNYKNFLLEELVNKKELEKQKLEEIRTKFYPDISLEDYYLLLGTDPTSKKEEGEVIKKGGFSTWLLDLYKDGNLKLEDLEKTNKYLIAFRDFNRLLNKKSIEQYKDVPELYSTIKEYLPKEEDVPEDEYRLIGQFKEVYRDKKYRIIIPLTLDASRYFGRGTSWCTINTNMFEEYTKKQNPDIISEHNLYILYSNNLTDRLQFHFNSQQFMDVNDENIDVVSFMEDFKDIFNFFKKSNKNCIFKNIVWKKDTLVGAPRVIEGYFHCDSTELTSLIGGPEEVKGYFSCSNNKLTDLKGMPKIISGDFYCNHNLLTNLKDIPKNFKCETFDCSYNNITSLADLPDCHSILASHNNIENLNILERKRYLYLDISYNRLTSLNGCPETITILFCRFNKLKNLKGSPKRIEREFRCDNNEITSLEGGPEYAELYFCHKNKLTNLTGAPKSVNYRFTCGENNITSLIGAPEKNLNLAFFCEDNKLTDLQGAPKELYSFDCRNNNLTTFEGGPEFVINYYWVGGNNISNDEIIKLSSNLNIHGLDGCIIH